MNTTIRRETRASMWWVPGMPFALTVKFADGHTSVIRVLAVIKPLETTANEGHEHHH